jgi:signal transduction histidine kinase
MHPDGVQGGGAVKNIAPAVKSPLRNRLVLALVIYTGVILALWAFYHNANYAAVKTAAGENAMLSADALTEHIGSELTQMKAYASVIAGSVYVQEFLKEAQIPAFYEKAAVVSEIIEKAAFPVAQADNVIAMSMRGDFYRFSGGLSNHSCEEIHELFKDSGTVFTVAELDGALYFCHNAPVYDSLGRFPVQIGNIVRLTGIEKMRRTLDFTDAGHGIDTAVIYNGFVILSSDPELEGKDAGLIGQSYGTVSVNEISDTPLSVLAAVPDEALNPGNNFFRISAFVILSFLLIMIFLLYRYLLSYIVREPEMVRQKMRISLLASQMDAHFVVNTIGGIKALSERGESEKAAQMAESLAAIIKHQHKGDALVNVFVDFEIIESFIRVMHQRYGEVFTVDFNVDDRLEACLIPGFILQPIVENALDHGLLSKETDARLEIIGRICGDKVVFEISDNGAGIAPEELRTIQGSLVNAAPADFPEPGLHGVALVNIQRRIRLRFGDQYGLAIESRQGGGTDVTVTLPLIPDE